MQNNNDIEKEDVLKYQIELNDDEGRRGLTMARELRRIEDIVHIQNFFPNVESILCIGSRDDSEVQTFINNGYDAKGIDICRSTNLITQMDMAELSPDFGTFDFVYCSHVLEHVSDPIKVFKAIKSVMRKGIFIILPIVDRPPDIEHPTVYEIMKYNPETKFKDYPQAFEDFIAFSPFSIPYSCYRNASTEEYEVAFILEV